jgi:hypothetical protein
MTKIPNHVIVSGIVTSIDKKDNQTNGFQRPPDKGDAKQIAICCFAIIVIIIVLGIIIMTFNFCNERE